MEEFHIAGAVVGITDGSNTLFLRGYGSADLETETAVDPETTLFRAGSISKLFTWTAIMQLEEEGRLGLNDPVEKYLDFELPNTFDQPIRIIDLMNHTPGFEDRRPKADQASSGRSTEGRLLVVVRVFSGKRINIPFHADAFRESGR